MTPDAAELPVAGTPGRCGCSDPEDEAVETCYCTVDHLVSAISRKHALPILNFLGNRGPTRFNRVQEAISGVSSSTLSDTLQELTDVGLVRRSVFAEKPPRVEYRLTDAGELLCSRFHDLLDRVRGADREE